MELRNVKINDEEKGEFIVVEAGILEGM